MSKYDTVFKNDEDFLKLASLKAKTPKQPLIRRIASSHLIMSVIIISVLALGTGAEVLAWISTLSK